MNEPTRSATQRLILVVDDNQDAVLLLQRLLQLKGYAVHACFDGQSALEAAERLQPAGILLDLAMPGMDGFTLCRLMRARPWGAGPLIIALSGYSSAADQQRSQEAGFDHYVTKPVDLVALLGLLNEQFR